MDMRSILAAAAVIGACTVLPSSVIIANDNIELYSGEYRDLFEGYGIKCTNPTAEYSYLSFDDSEDVVYHGDFTYRFDTSFGSGLLYGSFFYNQPVERWKLEYGDKIEGIEDEVTVNMTIPFDFGDPNGVGWITLTTWKDGVKRTIDSGDYTLEPTGTTSLRTSNGRYLSKITVSMDDAINVIRSIRPVMDPNEVYGQSSDEELDPYARVTDIIILDDDELIDFDKGEPVEIVDESQVKNVIVSYEEAFPEDDHKFDAVQEQVVVQEYPVEPPKPVERIYVAVEEPAEFPGGQAAMMRWIQENLRYPESAKENGISGRVVVKFVVEKDGSVHNPQVVRGVSRELDKEAERLIESMPAWRPGRNNGIPVRSYYNLPVTFRLPE